MTGKKKLILPPIRLGFPHYIKKEKKGKNTIKKCLLIITIPGIKKGERKRKINSCIFPKSQVPMYRKPIIKPKKKRKIYSMTEKKK